MKVLNLGSYLKVIGAILIFMGIAFYLAKSEQMKVSGTSELLIGENPMSVPEIQKFVASVKEQRMESQFLEMDSQDRDLSILQGEFSKSLADYDQMEKQYQLESTEYSKLLMKFIDEPNHPDLVAAFEKSDRLLNDLLVVNLRINSLAEQLQEKYKNRITN